MQRWLQKEKEKKWKASFLRRTKKKLIKQKMNWINSVEKYFKYKEKMSDRIKIIIEICDDISCFYRFLIILIILIYFSKIKSF